MFDIGFWELFLIFGIALIVLGPERLPVVARSVGHWTGRARAFVRNLSTELDREVRKSEAAKSFAEAKRMMEDKVVTDDQTTKPGTTTPNTTTPTTTPATTPKTAPSSNNGQTAQSQTKAEPVPPRE